VSSRGTVLVIDDDADVRQTVAYALEDAGYRVLLAVDGRDALDILFESEIPDIVLLDMMMPRMDGWEFRAEQRKHPAIASIPLVLFTAYGVTPETVRELGAQGILKKPLRLDELLATVECVTATP
jgi:CheY-like chemotaxis protein